MELIRGRWTIPDRQTDTGSTDSLASKKEDRETIKLGTTLENRMLRKSVRLGFLTPPAMSLWAGHFTHASVSPSEKWGEWKLPPQGLVKG